MAEYQQIQFIGLLKMLSAKRNIIIIYLSIVCAILISSCRKELPVANFISDKTEYTAGDTIHLIDASENAYYWKWTLPDGNIKTDKNIDYILDKNDDGGLKKITLEVANKKNKKADIIYKSITCKPYSEFYLNNGKKYKPQSVSCGVSGGNWTITANYTIDEGHGDNTYHCTIYFRGNSAPNLSSNYILKPTHDSLQPNEASIVIGWSGPEIVTYNTNSVSGELNLTINTNNKLRAIFNNIPSTDSNKYLFGNITCE